MTPSRVHVRLQFTTGSEISVGTIARSSQRIVFQYDETFLDRPLPLSPFRLPVQQAAHIADGAGRMETFGVFDDAMPDGWGRRVLEGAFRQRVGRAPDTIERLLLVGTRGMGALTFHPSIEEADAHVTSLTARLHASTSATSHTRPGISTTNMSTRCSPNFVAWRVHREEHDRRRSSRLPSMRRERCAMPAPATETFLRHTNTGS